MKQFYLKTFFLLLFVMTGTTASAYNDIRIGDIYYNLNESAHTAEVTKYPYYYGYYSGDIDIPSSVNYREITYNVTSIGFRAFYECSNLTSITIPSSVTFIDYQAFTYCSSLTSVHISDIAAWCNITFNNNPLSIAKHLYLNGVEVKDLVIPNTVTSIGTGPFSNFSGLLTVTLSEGVTSIGENAFNNCSGLTSVNIPSSVTSIGRGAFSGCRNLNAVYITDLNAWCGISFLGNPLSEAGHLFLNGAEVKDLVIPNGITCINRVAFSGCIGLTSVTIPSSVTSIEEGAFCNCVSLTNVAIQSGVTNIDNQAFYGCSKLTNITIPNSVSTIGGRAFENCISLGSITIPSSVSIIGERSFRNCYSLSSINLSEGIAIISSGMFENCSCLTSVTIPNTVTNIEASAFYNCTSLTSITIPDGVTNIGSGAFEKCTSLTSITIPDGVTVIGREAFNGCTNLTSITIPNNLSTIGYRVFYGCTSLTSITIPSGVTSIDGSAFVDCNLQTIIVEPENSVYDSRDNCNAIIKTDDNELILGCKNTIIPNTVTSIGNDAFRNCDLTIITIPNSVTRIGKSAFYGCSSLTKVVIPDILAWCVIEFGDIYSNPISYAHHIYTDVDTEIIELRIPDGVTAINNFAFYGCTGLVSLTIPSSVTNISNTAFNECSELNSLHVEGGNTVYYSYGHNAVIETATDKLILGCQSSRFDKVRSIGARAFYGCRNLTSIEIVGLIRMPECRSDLTSIGESAFENCTNLADVDLFNGLANIGERAFYGCPITLIKIPSTVTQIGKYAFNTGNLHVVYSYSETPPYISDNTFPNSPTVVAIVPEASTAVYKAATGWKNLTINSLLWCDKTTQTTITLKSHDFFTNQTATLNGTTYSMVDGKIMIPDLSPNKTYTIETSGMYRGLEIKGSITATTKEVTLNMDIPEVTNTTATVKGTYKAGDAIIMKSGFVGYEDKDEIVIKNLVPGKEYEFTYYIECSDGSRFTTSKKVKTVAIEPTVAIDAKATSCTLLGRFDNIDATIEAFGFEDEEAEGDTLLVLHGLDPYKSYTKTFFVTTKEGGKVSKTVTFTTEVLNLKTLVPKVISAGNVIVSAETNIDDEEMNVGFEWRRTDWTDEFASKTGGAALYEGVMEGYIRSLYTEKLWKYRPYYISDSGVYHYGDWMGIDPTDVSYFEPTVHTYEKISLNGNTAMIKGYAMQGTDGIKLQGFVYWPEVAGAKPYKTVASVGPCKTVASVPSDAMTVEASGQVMTATLSDLVYSTTYSYAAFVTTKEGDTFYGEQQSFTTGNDPDIVMGDINNDGKIDVSDYIGIANRILGQTPVGFNEQAADVNGDGVIDVSDYIGVANIILTGNIHGK